MTVNLCPVSGVSVPRFRGICAPFPPPFLPFCAPFQGYLLKDIKDLKVFISRGNAGFYDRLIPLNRIKKKVSPGRDEAFLTKIAAFLKRIEKIKIKAIK